MSVCLRILTSLVLVLCTPAIADVSGPPQLAPAFRTAELSAVARMRGATARTGGCSAVLIAPDRALTAAHCVGRTAQRVVIFNATGANRMSVLVERVERHPDYNQTRPPSATGYSRDLALLYLGQSVPPEVAQPLTIGPLSEAAEHGAFGYVNRNGPGIGSVDDLRGNEPCLAVNTVEGPIASTCSVANGQSGGAFVHLTDDGPVLVGILVAQIVRGGFRSLISPVTPEDWPALATTLAR